MSAETEVIAYSAAAPAAAALAVAWLLRVLLPAAAAGRYALAVGLAAGFFLGYWLLPDEWAPLVPARHWHWLAYLAAVAALVGGLCLAEGVSIAERWLVYLALALVVAWRVVPTWSHLWPPQIYTIPLLAAYLWLLMALLAALPDRLLGRTFAGLLAAAAIGAAIVIALPVSAKIGIVAMVAAAATTGCLVAILFAPKSEVAVRGLIPVFVVLVGSLALVGSVELKPPHLAMFLPPAAPLMFWLFAVGPLARLQGASAVAAQAMVALLPIVIAIAWVALGSSEADEWSRLIPRWTFGQA